MPYTQAVVKQGQSVQGRPIPLWVVSAFPDELFPHEPLPQTFELDTLFIGVFHGDEGLSGKLLEKFQTFLLAPEMALQAPLPFIGIIPALNPDGLAANTRTNARGVDLNRNFPTADWVSENSQTPYYSGPAAASEPETGFMLDVIEAYRPQKIISVHTPYKVLNYDGPARELAEAMSKTCHYPVVESIGYPTPGSFGTYAGKERQIPTITLELPEDEPLEAVWQVTRQSLLEAIYF